MSGNWSILAFVNLGTLIAAMLYVARTPLHRSLMTRVMSAPAVIPISAYAAMVLIALGAAILQRRDPVAALHEGVVIGCYYAVVLALIGVPGAILGGLLAVWLRSCRPNSTPKAPKSEPL